jgi:hypothetical protein
MPPIGLTPQTATPQPNPLNELHQLPHTNQEQGRNPPAPTKTQDPAGVLATPRRPTVPPHLGATAPKDPKLGANTATGTPGKPTPPATPVKATGTAADLGKPSITLNIAGTSKDDPTTQSFGVTTTIKVKQQLDPNTSVTGSFGLGRTEGQTNGNPFATNTATLGGNVTRKLDPNTTVTGDLTFSNTQGYRGRTPVNDTTLSVGAGITHKINFNPNSSVTLGAAGKVQVQAKQGQPTTTGYQGDLSANFENNFRIDGGGPVKLNAFVNDKISLTGAGVFSGATPTAFTLNNSFSMGLKAEIPTGSADWQKLTLTGSVGADYKNTLNGMPATFVPNVQGGASLGLSPNLTLDANLKRSGGDLYGGMTQPNTTATLQLNWRP